MPRAGRSERPDDPSLWTTGRFVEELGQVRTGLGLDRVHLLGHSWGTMLAAEYLLTGPAGVESVVMSSPCISANPVIYNSIWGPSEFTITGSLKGFERAENLRRLELPMLFLCGEHDEATPWTTEYYRSQAPNGEIRVLENCSHMSMVEAPDLYVGSVRQFLRRVEA